MIVAVYWVLGSNKSVGSNVNCLSWEPGTTVTVPPMTVSGVEDLANLNEDGVTCNYPHKRNNVQKCFGILCLDFPVGLIQTSKSQWLPM